MLKRELLEKPYDFMNDILVYLYNNGGTCTKDELCKNLVITPNTLTEYLALLADFVVENGFSNSIEIIEEQQTLTFKKDPTFPLKVCFLKFLEHSTKFQIVKWLFDNGSINGPVFQDQFNISSATYYRRIAELNELLEEFQITIKRGKITGSENQIRYFFYSYYWFLKENKSEFSKEVNQMYGPLIQDLKEQLDVTFDQMEELQIKLWMKISFTRFNQTRDYSFPKDFEQKDRPLFDIINSILFQYMKNYDRPYTLHEGLMFYDFFCSTRNFSVYSSFAFRLAKQQREEKTYLDYQNQQILSYLCRIGYIESEAFPKRHRILSHYLYQYHSQLYYFNGFVLNFDSWGIFLTAQNLRTPTDSKDVHDFMDFCQNQFYPDDPLQRYRSILSEINYSSILNIAQDLSNKRILISVHHSVNPFLASLTIQILKNTLGNKYELDLVLYEEDTPGDILLSNIYLESFRTRESYYYVFSDCCNKYDVAEIETLIQQVISERFTQKNPYS
ncbi:helix-turn-helix domain-containing protein [Enterococcus sp. S86.2]|uniref:helix-turn-helix domain-containing protein n=1 Tax=Enterococcus sp. S86.2 TaxID=3031299 RepID=UPI0026E9CCAE|nr:helix-turn-helix domain-containing protein [Enterococcus sp. S86.2]